MLLLNHLWLAFSGEFRGRPDFMMLSVILLFGVFPVIPRRAFFAHCCTWRWR